MALFLHFTIPMKTLLAVILLIPIFQSSFSYSSHEIEAEPQDFLVHEIKDSKGFLQLFLRKDILNQFETFSKKVDQIASVENKSTFEITGVRLKIDIIEDVQTLSLPVTSNIKIEKEKARELLQTLLKVLPNFKQFAAKVDSLTALTEEKISPQIKKITITGKDSAFKEVQLVITIQHKLNGAFGQPFDIYKTELK
jgi:Glu-tRNA(Gln) amidotransferase subunit E-like FAD-binding protein